MAVPVIASSTSNSGGSTATLTMTKPSGVNVGDLLVVICGSEAGNSNGYLTPPAGWNLVNYSDFPATVGVSAFWRIADGTEPATTNFTQSITRDSWGAYLRITGADSTTPIHVVGSDYASSPIQLHSIVGVTTTLHDCLAIAVGSAPNTGSFPYTISGWSVTNENSGGGSACSGFRATKSVLTAGSSGNAVVDFTPDTVALAGFIFAIGSPTEPRATLGRRIAKRAETPLEALRGRATRPWLIFVPPPAPVAGGVRPIRRALHQQYDPRQLRGRVRRDPPPFPVPSPFLPLKRRTAKAQEIAGQLLRGRVRRSPPLIRLGLTDIEIVLLADLDILTETKYRVTARNLSTGVETVLGTATAAAPTIAGVALADGQYLLRVESDARFWRGARYAREYPITISGGAIGTSLPPVLDLAAQVSGSSVLVTWTYELLDGQTAPADFAIWTSATSPVSTAGAPVAIASVIGIGGYLAEIAGGASVVFVAVAARIGATKGPVSEVAVTGSASMNAPGGSSARIPDGGWSTT